jgi:hypothetical protein
MIVIRNVFQLKFGKAREAVALMKELAIQKRALAGTDFPRVLTDVTGPFYTLVLEPQCRIWRRLRPLRPNSSEMEWQASTKTTRWWSPAIAGFSLSSTESAYSRSGAAPSSLNASKSSPLGWARQRRLRGGHSPIRDTISAWPKPWAVTSQLAKPLLTIVFEDSQLAWLVTLALCR